MLQWAKVELNSSVAKCKRKLTQKDIDVINSFQSTLNSQEIQSQDETDCVSFGNSFLRDIALQQRLNINESHYYQKMSSENEIKETQAWLDKVSKEASALFQRTAEILLYLMLTQD